MRLIADGFLNQAQQRPDQPAVVLAARAQAAQTLTYGELHQQVMAIASAVAALPRSHDQPWVGLLLTNGLEFLTTFLGTAIAGGVAVVYDPRWSTAQIEQVISSWPPDAVVAAPEWISTLHATGVKAIAADLVPWQDPPFTEPIGIPDRAPFYIGFTSGTTSRPKGVVRHHRSWVKSFEASQVEFHITATDRVLIPGPLTHSLTLYAALEALNAGATAHLLRQFDSRTAIAQLQHSITHLVLVPLMLSAILKTARAKGLQFPSVQTVITGGAALAPELRDRIPQVFPQAEIVDYYGALELSFVSLKSSQEAAPATSVGRPFYGVEVSVRRDDGSGTAAIGEIGWLGVRSELVCLGYLESDGSGLRMIDGWATVGDRGWKDANGYLHLIGREDDMIVTGGVNVYPSEVESVLCEWPEIEEVAVLGLPDGDRGEGVAAVICWAGLSLSRAEILQRSRLSLPDYKCPRQLFTTREFPRTPSGKIIRPELRQWILTQQQIEPIP